jgi:hypothetical protein
MNLVCFPNFTAGGLLCDLYNKTQTLIQHGTVRNKEHSVLKISNFDNPNKFVWDDVVYVLWEKRCKQLSANIVGKYYGTHLPAQGIRNKSDFTHIINITTNSHNSKFYRWLRYYYLEIDNRFWLDTESKINSKKVQMDNYKNFVLQTSSYDDIDCENVEFSDIVNGSYIQKKLLDESYFQDWKKQNNFLFEPIDSLLIEYFNQTS